MDWKPEAETKVRNLLNGWANSIPGNPFQDFGNTVSLISLAEKPSFVVQLDTLYEARFRPIERIKPYSESMAEVLTEVLPVAETITPDSVDIWKFESPLRNEFAAQEADIDVPDSFHALPCSICEGKGGVSCAVCGGTKVVRCAECRIGKKPCEKCSGRGRTPCSHCRGKGYTPGVRENKPGPDVLCVDCNGSGGNPCETCKGSGGFPCDNCRGQGALPCIRCKGRGTQPCQQCSSTGKTVKGLSFKIQYTNADDRSVVHDPQIPEGLMPSGFLWSRVSERIVEAQDIIVPPPNLSSHPPYANAAVEGILKKAEGAVSAQAAPARIIRQSLLVERVPVFSIVYRFEGKMYDAWVTAVDNKVVSKESPFKSLAREEALRAMKLAAQGNQSQAQELLAKASALGGEDLDLKQVQQASEQSSSRDFLVLHQFSSVLAGMALMALLGFSHGPTRHLFWPVFSFGVSACIVSLVIGYVLASSWADSMLSSRIKRILISVVVATGVAILAGIQFSIAQIPHGLDVHEYKGLMAEHFNGIPQPESMNPSDLDFLKFMIATYEPLEVDVSDARNALEEGAKLEEMIRRQAEARAKAQAEAKGRKAAKAELVRQEIEAARRKSQQQSALKSKKKKKPAQKKTSYGQY